MLDEWLKKVPSTMILKCRVIANATNKLDHQRNLRDLMLVLFQRQCYLIDLHHQHNSHQNEL
jgi:hypothetical protein